jgi:hypothetical protein
MDDNEIRRTETDGLEAIWALKKCQHIEIKKARDTATGEVIEFVPGTDLADAREQTSWRWAALWDRVSHAMWDEWTPSRRSSPAAQGIPDRTNVSDR